MNLKDRPNSAPQSCGFEAFNYAYTRSNKNIITLHQFREICGE